MNFLCSPKKTKHSENFFNWCFAVFLFVALSFFLSGCQSTSYERRMYKKSRSNIFPQKGSLQGTDDSSVPPVEVVKKEVPKIGLIFGAGGVKTFAYTGVMEVLVQNKIPIHGVVGIEWGALVGGFLASEGKVTQVQWRLNQLKEKDVIHKGFLSGRFERHKVDSFLKQVVPKETLTKSIRSFKYPFSCPTVSYLVGSTTFKSSGEFRKALKHCVPTPPLFEPEGVWVADAGAIEESIRYLKQSGANVIYYVSVLGKGDLFKRKDLKGEPGVALYWQQVKRANQKVEPLKRVYPELRVLNVKTSQQTLFNVKDLHLLPLSGRRAAKQMVEELQEDFGL